MTHQEMQDMYELYALGVLEPSEKSEIDEHLSSGCEVCRSAVRKASLTNAMLLSFAPDAAPPGRLKRRVMASIGVERRNWSWLAWAAVTASLAVLAGWYASEARNSSAELAGARQLLEIIKSPETREVSFGAGPRGNVFVHPRSGVFLIARNLPKLESGKRFEMWVIPKGGKPVPAGLFDSDAGGAATHLRPGAVDLGSLSAVAVSVEPEGGSAQPTTTPILVAALTGP